MAACQERRHARSSRGKKHVHAFPGKAKRPTKARKRNGIADNLIQTPVSEPAQQTPLSAAASEIHRDLPPETGAIQLRRYSLRFSAPSGNYARQPWFSRT